MADRVVLDAENGVARYYPETDDDPDAEVLEVGRRVLAADGKYFELSYDRSSDYPWFAYQGDDDLSGPTCTAKTALEALRALDAPEEG